MFELDINKIKEQSMQFVDTAYKAAMDIADKGKNQLDLASQQNRLAKAQRQLGALVYSLHKAEEENQPLVDKYIENIAEIEKAIEEIKARMTPDEAAAAEAAAADLVIRSRPLDIEQSASLPQNFQKFFPFFAGEAFHHGISLVCNALL